MPKKVRRAPMGPMIGVEVWACCQTSLGEISKFMDMATMKLIRIEPDYSKL